MHRGNQKLPSLFKSNRSQASLLSTLSAAPSELQQPQGDRVQQLASSASAQPSPIDSPVYSPSFPPNSSSTSPLGLDDNSSSQIQDYAPEQADELEQKPLVKSKPQPRKLQRNTSHRNHPTSAAPPPPPPPPPPPLAAGADVAAAAHPQSPRSISAIEANNIDTSRPQAVTATSATSKGPAPAEPKKKHRFWSRSESSNKEKSKAGPKGLGRSNSTRDSPSQRIITQQIPASQQPASPKLSSHVEEDEREKDISARKLYNRHSVAFPNPTVPEELRNQVGSGGFEINSPYSNRNQDTAATTAPSQQSSGQGGVHRTSFKERIGQRPHHIRTVSHEQYGAYTAHQGPQGQSGIVQQSRPELNYPEGHHKQDSRPSSQQSNEHSPSPSYSQIAFHQKSPSVQSAVSISSMGPPQGAQHPPARNQDTVQSQLGSREAGQYGSTLSVNQQGLNNYRSNPQTPSMAQQNSNPEQGRNTGTPPPARSRDDLSQLDMQQLVAKHEELNDKYRKVKKYYFDKDAQVQQLQNTLAVQRLAQSRTSLDDNEYGTRFSRLDGAINNLAFNIRKDWKAVPRWLAPYVNQDATTTATKEMTAVGRACISRWIVDEIFDRYFHPAIEPNFSSNLKTIERNLRRFAPPAQTEEEREALLSKISNWRLSTLDGLHDQLNMHEATEYRSALTKILVEMLTADLTANLKDPAPAGLEAGVVGIIELAVGISASLPTESRDVYIDYIMPGALVNELYMKIEGSLPPLTNPGEGHDMDRASVTSIDPDEEELLKEQAQQSKKKGGMFVSLMGGTKKAPQGSLTGRSQESVEQMPKEPKVRFAAFLSVEVRGKVMLIKAPVYV